MADVAAAAAPGAVPEKPAPQKLDELMLAMDVVDTLRHQEGLVEKALAEDERDAALKTRLRQIYEGQGLAVSDRILADGIRALKESRFVYDPAPPSFRRTLALMWVRRGLVARVAAVVVVALGLVGGYGYWHAVSAERAAEAARVEISVTLPHRLDVAAAAVTGAAVTDDAKAEAARLVADARAALATGDAAATTAALSAIDAFGARLAQTYALQIVSRPGERTGVFRVPDDNRSARNYYIIVEAVTPEGRKIAVPVTSEENGAAVTAEKWGVRVPKATYDAVARDKQDDGIVENNVLGVKERGHLTPTYAMPVERGAITSW
jgi:hypothetical protein